MTIRSIAIIGAVVAGVASFAAVAPANANIPTDVAPQARVAYGDLDLTSAAGRKTLVRRVHGASEQVCETGDSGKRLEEAACRSEANERAMADLKKAGVSVL